MADYVEQYYTAKVKVVGPVLSLLSRALSSLSTVCYLPSVSPLLCPTSVSIACR